MDVPKSSESRGAAISSLWLIPFAIWGLWMLFKPASEPIEVSIQHVQAMQQLQRDLERIERLPKHQRLSEFLEAMVRANQASPDLVEWLETHDNENYREWGSMLRVVREHPNSTNPEFLERLSLTLKYDPDFFMKLPPPQAK